MTPERERLVAAVEEANAAAMRIRLRYGRISEESARKAIEAQGLLNEYDRRDYLWSLRQSLAQSARRTKEAEQRVTEMEAAIAAHDRQQGGEG